MTKTIITVTGKDCVGIIAKTTTYLSDHSINILDITQTIRDDFFNMMMIVDTSTSTTQFNQLVDELTALGQSLGVIIHVQNEAIFDAMHRI